MNDDMTTYDKAKWHYEGDYPRDLPEKNAYTHSGMFLAWLADMNLLASTFTQDFQTELRQLHQRKITPGHFFEIGDGVLASDMLNDEGNAFAKTYFNLEGCQYVIDYQELLVKQLPSFYHAADTWENYERLKERIDQRYAEWKNTQAA